VCVCRAVLDVGVALVANAPLDTRAMNVGALLQQLGPAAGVSVRTWRAVGGLPSTVQVSDLSGIGRTLERMTGQEVVAEVEHRGLDVASIVCAGGGDPAATHLRLVVAVLQDCLTEAVAVPSTAPPALPLDMMDIVVRTGGDEVTLQVHLADTVAEMWVALEVRSSP